MSIPRYLLLGRTGVGKSSFVNSTFGVSLARISAFEACTKVVEYYARETPWGDLCIIDTPGLAEDSIEQDLAYLKLINRSVNLFELNGVFYVSRLDQTRTPPDERRTIKLITKQLGRGIWERVWLILTFAASVSVIDRRKQTDSRTHAIYVAINDAISEYDGLYGFEGFESILLIDNVVYEWCPSAKPVASFLV